MITIAVSRGRIKKDAIKLLGKIGINIDPAEVNSRKIILPTNVEKVQMVIMRGEDVIAYTDKGVVDVGIVGKDLIEEHNPQNCLEMADLKSSTCRLVCATRMGFDLFSVPGKLKVATKYDNLAIEYFAKLGRQIQIVHLRGSVEMAPNLGMADCIVDIVDTGLTLEENKLEAVAEILPISARIIFNYQRYITKLSQLENLLTKIEATLSETV